VARVEKDRDSRLAEMSVRAGRQPNVKKGNFLEKLGLTATTQRHAEQIELRKQRLLKYGELATVNLSISGEFCSRTPISEI
jgi:hypothetical protein